VNLPPLPNLVTIGRDSLGVLHSPPPRLVVVVVVVGVVVAAAAAEKKAEVEAVAMADEGGCVRKVFPKLLIRAQDRIWGSDLGNREMGNGDLGIWGMGKWGGGIRGSAST